ncbi:MAG: hypothetical protein PWP53_650 [Lacrimispora sp.]|nr:hypothetical protein [Lacrimispora sp.]
MIATMDIRRERLAENNFGNRTDFIQKHHHPVREHAAMLIGYGEDFSVELLGNKADDEIFGTVFLWHYKENSAFLCTELCSRPALHNAGLLETPRADKVVIELTPRMILYSHDSSRGVSQIIIFKNSIRRKLRWTTMFTSKMEFYYIATPVNLPVTSYIYTTAQDPLQQF